MIFRRCTANSKVAFFPGTGSTANRVIPQSPKKPSNQTLDKVLKKGGGDNHLSPPLPMPNKELLKAERSNYLETCCSCRRRTNCVEKTAANKPIIGKNVLASGIGLTTSVNS